LDRSGSLFEGRLLARVRARGRGGLLIAAIAWHAVLARTVAAAPPAPPAPAPAATPAAPDPNTIKAEMFWNIAKFIRWPDAAFTPTQGQLVVSIVGEDELAAVLVQSLGDRRVSGRPVFVRFVRRAQDVQDSQILYIAASERHRTVELLAALHGRPALTVSDAPGFTEQGGMVDFASENQQVRFEINQQVAERAGLKISSRLLALARVVAVSPPD
jgi:hypothetical protein